MAENFTISEVSHIVALPTHTIRYYEKQFPNLLDVSRSRGGHRIYKKHHLVALKEIIRLLKEKNFSIRKTKQVLGEEEKEEKVADNSAQFEKADSNQLTAILMNVVKRLDVISESNARQQLILEELLKKHPFVNEDALLENVEKCNLVKSHTSLLRDETIGFIKL